jgi:hypothetical protein
VSATFDGSSSGADEVDIEVAVAGGAPKSSTVTHNASASTGSVEVDFATYPVGQSIDVTLVARKGGTQVGTGHGAVSSLAGGCGVLAIAIGGNDGGQGGASGSGGTAGAGGGGMSGTGGVSGTGGSGGSVGSGGGSAGTGTGGVGTGSGGAIGMGGVSTGGIAGSSGVTGNGGIAGSGGMIGIGGVTGQPKCVIGTSRIGECTI